MFYLDFFPNRIGYLRSVRRNQFQLKWTMRKKAIALQLMQFSHFNYLTIPHE